jgi:hypothetical protein
MPGAAPIRGGWVANIANQMLLTRNERISRDWLPKTLAILRLRIHFFPLFLAQSFVKVRRWIIAKIATPRRCWISATLVTASAL